MAVMMTHEQFRDRLSDFADGALTGTERGEFWAHRESCPACAVLADTFALALTELHSLPRLEVPPGFTARVLARTLGRDAPGTWAVIRDWLGLPRLLLNPSAAVATLVVILTFFAGTREGRQMTREVSMATHQTYSNALRLYHRSDDLKQTAVAVGRRIPGQIGETVDWLRQRLGPAREEPATPREAPDSGADLRGADEPAPRA
jgi:anti-sigma factor RsiW